MKSFASDNYAGVVPEVMEALHNVNMQHARSYGADTYTKNTIELFKTIFGQNIDVYFVFNGTGANVLSISAATQTFNSVLCGTTSHIYCDESSAPETITGCRFFPLQVNEDGKITPESVKERLIRKGDVHYSQTSLLSITQSTEYGTIYTPAEIKQLADLAHSNDLFLHVDGSRFFNAAASLSCELSEISSLVGVDILSLGGTKAGMMFGEAVIVFNEQLKKHIAFKHKQVMQLASKTRFISAQFNAMLTNDTWRKYAQHANNMAQKLQSELHQLPNVQITKPVQANAIFAVIPRHWYEPLQDYFPFYVWNDSTHEVRLMCSWDTQDEDIIAFINAMKQMQ